MENSENYSPIRKIGKNHTSLTGRISSQNSERLYSFESSLERDFIQITDFNPYVSRFIEQPLTISYTDEVGSGRTYTPDFLIFYKNDNPRQQKMKPLLVEVKYREELKKNWSKYKPKFKAASQLCREKDWDFRFITEREIRGDYLFNVKFLNNYRNSDDVRIEDVSYLLDNLQVMKETTPKDLLSATCYSEKRKGFLLYTLWHMVAIDMIKMDLSLRISMNSLIWI
ncbi:heteromeric transposase endonuclease subunit TnsA [Marivirga lumbricoides]|uniref:Heteromeric transposase endonuclease subunit TnsA n=1 Tax=Marivirga lumbricoides TaxID=1046115 RepID=A0A2T4DRA3_9BACT|nr:heteromeric transposase endonuclease subunit TnsA [Marivirga lumbricoides]